MADLDKGSISRKRKIACIHNCESMEWNECLVRGQKKFYPNLICRKPTGTTMGSAAHVCSRSIGSDFYQRSGVEGYRIGSGL